jgi:hypothetical protein
MAYLCADRFAAYDGLNISATANRTTGFAPCGVIFNASATTSNQTAQPFHDLLYTWDFDDAGAGNFSYGRSASLSKDVAYGPIACHVYETAGTYTPTVTVFDGLSTKVYTLPAIVVTAADTQFPTTATVVCATDGVFTGKPTGATEVTTSDFDADVIPLITSGKRVLLKKGQTFTSSAAGTISGTVTGAMLGSWGTGAKPIVSASAAHSVISLSAVGTCTNLVIDGLEITGNTGASAISIGAPSTQLTVSNGNFHDIKNGLLCSGAGDTNTQSQTVLYNTIIDNLNGGGANGMFGWFNQFGFIGNSITDSTLAEHCMRVQLGIDGVVSANTLGPQAATKSCYLLRAIAPGTSESQKSKRVVISDNSGISNDNWAFTIAPSSDSTVEIIYDVITERNLITFASDTCDVGIVVCADDATTRNNIIIGSATKATGSENAIYCFERGAEGQHTNNMAYNNSFYTAGTTVARGVWFDATCDNSQAYNNAVWAPSGGVSSIGFLDQGSGNTSAANSTYAQIVGTSPFTDTTPANPVTGEFNPANYAVGGGTTKPVYDDFLSARRSYGNIAPTLSIGAVE